MIKAQGAGYLYQLTISFASSLAMVAGCPFSHRAYSLSSSSCTVGTTSHACGYGGTSSPPTAYIYLFLLCLHSERQEVTVSVQVSRCLLEADIHRQSIDSITYTKV